MYHDPKLMLLVYQTVQVGFSYRTVAGKLGITKDKVARIMKQFKKGQVRIENGKVVRVMKPTLQDKTPENKISLLLQVAEAQGGFRQKYCRELKPDGTCTLTYTEPIQNAPIKWINEDPHVRMKPTKLWCALCPYFEQR